MESTAQPTVQERMTKIETVMETERPHLATKADIGEVKLEIGDVKVEISEVRIEIAEVKVQIAELKATMIRWFIVTAIAMIAALVTLMGIFTNLILSRLP